MEETTDTSKNYFTLETQNKIIEYNNCKDSVLRDNIFRKYIYDAFYSISNSLVYRYRYYESINDISIKNLNYEVVSHMYNKMHMYNENNGKAFSYFSVIAKNYLTQLSYKKYRERIKAKSMEDIQYTIMDLKELAEHSERVELYNSLSSEFTKYIEDNYREWFKSVRQLNVCNAVISILHDYTEIDILERKLIIKYIENITNEDYFFIYNVLDKLKSKYIKYKEEFINNEY